MMNWTDPSINSFNIQETLHSEKYTVFHQRLSILEDIQQDIRYHPEGDVLYHSLQVFDLACDHYPYDSDVLSAALLHEVGKGIPLCQPDCQLDHVCHFDHIYAGLEILLPYISDTTAWLISHQRDAHKIADGSVGSRIHRKLKAHQSYDDLLFLQQCDVEGRKAGVETTSLKECLEYLKQISCD